MPHTTSPKRNPVDAATDIFKDILDQGIPSATAIWQRAQDHLATGDAEAAERCEKLNYLLHNSSIPNRVSLGTGVRFAYGGIGVIVHRDAEIRPHACIGSNVTIGGRAGGQARKLPNGKRSYVPLIEEHAYISTGACIMGGVTIGPMAIVGANAVVTEDVPPLAVVVGQPARTVSNLTPDNALRYKGMFSFFKNKPDDKFLSAVKTIYETQTKYPPRKS